MLIYKCVIKKKHMKACCTYPGKIHLKKLLRLEQNIMGRAYLYTILCCKKFDWRCWDNENKANFLWRLNLNSAKHQVAVNYFRKWTNQVDHIHVHTPGTHMAYSFSTVPWFSWKFCSLQSYLKISWAVLSCWYDNLSPISPFNI